MSYLLMGGEGIFTSDTYFFGVDQFVVGIFIWVMTLILDKAIVIAEENEFTI
ncbi:hypothetical protein [Streptococcus saliviloxodontae]|uniref:DUF2975 domain-containing protein n=1 Tax=Streptococcus saliviloxodontae TaxID=1349416 RepID=A0ABS2PIU8_9STRE|nr:hypothetical protein [Streptococcus saliviloxodontae]MBM7635358.1 hypothetical protein [Streptococcus saliviloxodontae]